MTRRVRPSGPARLASTPTTTMAAAPTAAATPTSTPETTDEAPRDSSTYGTDQLYRGTAPATIRKAATGNQPKCSGNGCSTLPRPSGRSSGNTRRALTATPAAPTPRAANIHSQPQRWAIHGPAAAHTALRHGRPAFLVTMATVRQRGATRRTMATLVPTMVSA